MVVGSEKTQDVVICHTNSVVDSRVETPSMFHIRILPVLTYRIRHVSRNLQERNKVDKKLVEMSLPMKCKST
jgi:hypothetical protein